MRILHGAQSRAGSNVVAMVVGFTMAASATAQHATAQVMTAPIHPHIRNLTDVDGNLASDSSAPLDPSTPVYQINTDPRAPVLGPDSHHYTMGEWQQVSGTARIESLADGTELTLELSGLVPNGVYTVWGAHFDDPPFNFDPYLPNFPDNVGIGAIGANDGSEAEITVDANGNATYTGVTPPGPLSEVGEAPLWALDGHSSYAIVGVYHIDGQTNGPHPGPNAVGHFFAGFNAIPEPSSVLIATMALCGLIGFRHMRRKVGTD